MKPNSAMALAAARALQHYDDDIELRELAEGWMVRFARTIHSDKRWSTIQRVNAWFVSNEDMRETDGFFSTSDDAYTPERLAWDLLGGDAGVSWAAGALMNAGTNSVTPELYAVEAAEEARVAAARNAETITVSGSAAAIASIMKGGVSVENASGNLARLADTPTSPVTTLAAFEGRRPEWEGTLTIEGITTSDNRLIEPGALVWRDLPIPLQDQLLSQPGHDGAVAAGPITEIFRDAQTGEAVPVKGRGFFDTGEDGQNAKRRMAEGTKQGVSVDLTEVEIFLPEDEEEIMEILFGSGTLRITAGKIAAATLVGIPAFEGARLQIIGDMDEMNAGALVASGGKLEGLTLTVVMPVETELALVASGGVLNEMREVIRFSPVSHVEFAPTEVIRSRLADALIEKLGVDDDEWLWVRDYDAEEGVVYFEHTGLEDGRLQGHDFEIGDDDSVTLNGDPYRVEVEIDYEKAAAAAQQESLVAAGGVGELKPPRAWFDAQEYTEPTAFTIEDPNADGLQRIHGHVAMRGSCHIGFEGRCVDVPMGLDYDSFQGDKVPNEVVCSNGERVKAGPVIMDTVHPKLKKVASDSYAHYAHTGAMPAQVRCYEDEFGLQIQGWIMPGTTAEDVVKLNAADLSPDWRPRATAEGGRGVVAILAVPVSGFNLGLVASGGEQLDDGEGDVSEMAIVGTNWTPRLTAAAQHKVEVLSRLGLDVPEHLALLASTNEDPALTDRKTRVLARLNGEHACDCGNACCSL